MIINADFLGHTKEHDSFAASAHENRQTNKEIDASGINGKIFNNYSFNGTGLDICTDDSTYTSSPWMRASTGRFAQFEVRRPFKADFFLRAFKGLAILNVS